MIQWQLFFCFTSRRLVVVHNRWNTWLIWITRRHNSEYVLMELLTWPAHPAGEIPAYAKLAEFSPRHVESAKRRNKNGLVNFWSLFSAFCWFVRVEVLRPSQPNGVMSSTVSLPNHTFTGQALSSKRLTSIVHILSPETDNCPSWISGRERMTVENISWSISTKECCRPMRGLNPRSPGLQSDGASNWAIEAGSILLKSWLYI